MLSTETTQTLYVNSCTLQAESWYAAVAYLTDTCVEARGRKVRVRVESVLMDLTGNHDAETRVRLQQKILLKTGWRCPASKNGHRQEADSVGRGLWFPSRKLRSAAEVRSTANTKAASTALAGSLPGLAFVIYTGSLKSYLSL